LTARNSAGDFGNTNSTSTTIVCGSFVNCNLGVTPSDLLGTLTGGNPGTMNFAGRVEPTDGTAYCPGVLSFFLTVDLPKPISVTA
jgi:hypothetical protein